jgi:beta-glucosidase
VPVGITLNLNTIRAASSDRADRAAATIDDGYLNRWFLDPIFGRGYPADIVELFGDLMPEIGAGDLDEIAAPIDFLGINNYFPSYTRAVERGPGHELGIAHLREAELAARGFEITEMGWPVAPDAFGELLVRVHRQYGPHAIYVTENGCAFADTVEGGAVHDDRRTAYLAGHLAALSGAIEAGSPVKGYFVWSLLDNFEWGHGYSKRFGVIHVDYPTQQRIVKDSGRWYGSLVRAHRAARGESPC